MKQFLFLLIFLFVGNLKFAYTQQLSAWAYVNLGENQNLVDNTGKGSLYATAKSSCSGGEAYVDIRGNIKVKSYSKNCPNSNHGNGVGSWKSSLRFKGTNGQNIPMKVNFALTGSQTIQTSPGSKCLVSLASVSLNLWIYTDTQEFKSSAFIQHQNGFLKTIIIKNIDNEDAYAEVTPKIGFTLEGVPREVKATADAISSLLENIKKTSKDELVKHQADLSQDFINALSGKAPLAEWEGTSKRMSQEEGHFLNAIQYFGLNAKFGIPNGLGIEMGVSFDVKFKYQMSKNINISTNSEYINTYLGVGSATIPQCEALSEADYSNTFKIVSVTIPDDYYNDKVDYKNLRVIIGDSLEIPITYNTVTGVEPNFENSLNIYPNPFDNKLKVSFDNPLLVNSILVIDESGKLIFSQQVNNRLQQHEILLPQTISSGIYFLRAITEKAIITKKITKL